MLKMIHRRRRINPAKLNAKKFTNEKSKYETALNRFPL